MMQWYASLEKFQKIIEPFAYQESVSIIKILLGLLIALVILYCSYHYLYLNKNRRLVVRLKKIAKECRKNSCSPESTLQAIHHLLKGQSMILDSVKQKIDRYRFSKNSPSVQNINDLLKSLESLLMSAKC